MPRQYPSLVAWRDCGCMSEIVVEAPNTYDLVGKLYSSASKRKTRVERIMPDQPMPDWECPEHKQARLNKKKQKALFTE
jgi:hypothetical protein